MIVMDGFKARQQGSELQAVRSCLLTSSDEPSSGPTTAMETPPESMSTEWTDEKHSMYLKSMEASFVNDLYDSMELLGWCPEKKNLLLSKKHSKQTRPKSSSSPPRSQFEVLRSGSWGKIHFDRARSQAADKANETSGDILSNPWILHFKSTAKNNKNGEPRSSPSQEIDHRGSHQKKTVPRWGASSSSNPFRFARQQDSRCDEAEASDQNFADEDDDEGEKKKRVKTQEIDSYSARDQVVPLHEPSSQGREKQCKSGEEDNL